MGYLTGSGRVGRLTHFLTMLAASAALLVAYSAWVHDHPVTGEEVVDTPFFVVVAASIWLQVMSSIRRFHDRGHSGFWVISMALPGIGFIVGLYLLFAPGDDGWNRFGGAAGAGAPAHGHDRVAHYDAVAEKAWRERHNERFLNEDGSFDFDGLYRDGEIQQS